MKMKKWTDKEVERLIKLSENYSLTDIAKKLNRSVYSVKNKLASLDINGPLTDRTYKWTFTQITESLGLGPRVVNTTFVKYGLKFEKTGRYCLVKEQDLLDFLKENPNLWDASKAECYLFCEYDWFLEKLEKDKNQKSSNDKYHWTNYEKQRFTALKRRGYTHEQIAKELGKTKCSIDSYSCQHKIVSEKGHFWTESQIQKFITLKGQGYTHEQIASELGKSKRAIDMFSFKHKNLIERKEKCDV
mgnify:CR=1 FL=1